MMQVAEFFLSSVDILSDTYLNVLVTSKIINWTAEIRDFN